MKEKRILSVSLGSSRRNHRVILDLLGVRVVVDRVGMDGDKTAFARTLREFDGKVDVFGLGGVDLYLRAGKYRYLIKDVARLLRGVHHTPVVDGGELKQVWEKEIPRYLVECAGMELAGKTALFMSGMDRYGLAEGLSREGCRLLIGDMPFALGIPIALRRLWTLRLLSVLMMPVLRRLPFNVLYPTGAKQDEQRGRFPRYFEHAAIIGGDFLFIKRFRPKRLPGKILITNSVTTQDIEELRTAGVKTLVTTTPDMNGRSFGANVLQAIFVALLEKKPEDILPEEYLQLMQHIGFAPRIIHL